MTIGQDGGAYTLAFVAGTKWIQWTGQTDGWDETE